MKSLKVHIFILFLFIVSFTVKAQTVFKDVTEEAGIDHVFQVFEGTFGGGAVIFDINNDGFEDIFITSGMAKDVLYLNNGDGTFKNIYKGSGLEISKGYVTQGAASADVNRDGFRDLYITTINTTDGTQKIPRARNLLFLNNGDLTFQDVTAAFGLDDMNSFSTGPSFGDVNADGYPDLYVGNYFQNFEGKLGIIKDATIVSANQTAQGYLLINREGKKFESVYDDYGLGHRGFGFGGVFTDYDNDGDQDLYVNHDFGFKAVPNLLYENQYPRKQFKSVGKEKGMDLKINAMASAVGDYDNNGYMDYYVTNIKFNRFMVNQGKDQPFIDLSKELSTYFLAISWGANFADFDLDGDLDLYVSNGDLNPNCVPMGNFYFENKNGTFIDMARVTKTNDYGLGRGTVVFDYDNDGDLDILLVNQQAVYEYPVESKTKLFRNDIPSGNWIKVALEGISAEKNGIGSRVTLVSGNTRMIREIDGGGSSHISQNSTIAHFGLGKNKMVDSLIVTWTGGKKQWILNPTLNTLITIVEIPDEPNYWAYAILGTSLVLSLMFLYFRRKKVA
ncbi:CRTAC1 family protein [Allomuricauda taeanensis]|uniref:CRTAC1 family protein n=1 Tax=Flagellimonas taeanensis TaxID=1005926 RepID=UPI002E7C4FF1|nr:CRTAC1 family protein [Allomuricauda taeanensis]MEE1963882.1 CRTAC1 family protein [Allomuricauda taeanensis]